MVESHPKLSYRVTKGDVLSHVDVFIHESHLPYVLVDVSGPNHRRTSTKLSEILHKESHRQSGATDHMIDENVAYVDVDALGGQQLPLFHYNRSLLFGLPKFTLAQGYTDAYTSVLLLQEQNNIQMMQNMVAVYKAVQHLQSAH